MKLSTVYCQNCRSANNLRETHCQKCGMRLLLVVFPNSLQYDTNHVPTFYEDHLLERVTTLEMQLGQTLEKLETAYDLIAQCVEISNRERFLLHSFLETIEELSPEIAEKITNRSREIYRNLKETETIKERQNKILLDIQQTHDNPNTALLTELVSKGIEMLANSEEKEAFQMLERAALISPKNITLFLFIAEELFRADNFAKAKNYLEKAFEFAPTNPKLLLLLGAIKSDEGKIVEARRWLSVIVHHETKSRAANLIWGILNAFESNWSEAAVSFKSAQGTEKTAEIEYLLGCAYFQLKREKIALRHFQKTVELDPDFSDAFFMQSVIYQNAKDSVNAESTRRKAIEIKENGALCSELLKNAGKIKIENALAFVHFQKAKAKILFGGSLRMTNFFKKIILKSIE